MSKSSTYRPGIFLIFAMVRFKPISEDCVNFITPDESSQSHIDECTIKTHTNNIKLNHFQDELIPKYLGAVVGCTLVGTPALFV